MEENQHALEIEAALLRGGIKVVDVVPINYGQQIKLGCGISVNVYDKGSIFVQGSLPAKFANKLLWRMRQVLPAQTKWKVQQKK